MHQIYGFEVRQKAGGNPAGLDGGGIKANGGPNQQKS